MIIRIAATLLLITVLANIASAQRIKELSLSEKDWPVMARSLRVATADSDTRMEKLLKENLNASNAELCARYTFWLQRVTTIDALISSVERFHLARVEADPMADVEQLLQEKLELAKRIEEQAKLLMERRLSAESETGQVAAKAYRIRVELRLERLKGK